MPEQTLAGVMGEIGRVIARTDYKPALERVADHLRADERSFFRAARSPAGQAWLPLSRYTIAEKGHGTILVDTGAMRKSVTVQGAADAIERVGRTSLVFGTRDPKAAKHQYGIGVPRRSFVGITASRSHAIPERIADHLLDQLKAQV